MNNDIKKYQFKEGLNHEFEIIDLAKIFSSYKDMMTAPHRAQFYHILWIEKGSGTHYVDFNPIEIENNCIVFVPHNSVNLFDKNGSYDGKLILFTKNFFCKNDNDFSFLHSSMLFSDLYDTSKIKFNPQISDLNILLNTIETEYQRIPDKEQYAILHNMLHVFLLQSERIIKQQENKEIKSSINLDYLIAYKSLLDEKFTKEKSVKNYASELNISEKQLHKITTSILDKTPKELITERIVLEAKRLLVHSSQSVKEIAYQLGYNEPTNFIKFFKKHAKTTPNEFREQF